MRIDSLVGSILGLGPGIPGSNPSLGKIAVFATPSLVWDPDVKQRKPSDRVTLSMGHGGASRKSPNDVPWETLSQKFSRPVSANP